MKHFDFQKRFETQPSKCYYQITDAYVHEYERVVTCALCTIFYIRSRIWREESRGAFTIPRPSGSNFFLACVAGGMRERASRGRAAIFLSGEAREEFASGEAASEFPACHISYGFCLPPTFIAFDESIK